MARPSGSRDSPTGVDERRADDHGVGNGPPAPALVRSLDAEANRNRQRGRLADPRHLARHLGDLRRLGAGDAENRNVIDEAGGVGEHGRQPPLVGGGRGQADEVQAGPDGRQAQLVILLRREIDDDQAVDAGRLGVGQEAIDAIDVYRIVITHENERGPVVALRNCRTMPSVLAMVWPALRARSPAAWIAGPSAIGSVKGMPNSITSAPAVGKRLDDGERGCIIGIAGGDEGDEGGAALRA